MIDSVLEDVPVEYHDKLQHFLAEDPIPVAELTAELEEDLRTVRHVAQLMRNFRFDALERLTQSALALLADTRDDPDRQRLAQVAARYLVEEEDDDEITGVLALDDDIAVINAIARAMGRPDLVVTKARR